MMCLSREGSQYSPKLNQTKTVEFLKLFDNIFPGWENYGDRGKKLLYVEVGLLGWDNSLCTFKLLIFR